MCATAAACLFYVTWIHRGDTQSNQSWRATARAVTARKRIGGETSTSITSIHSCPSLSRELSVHGARVPVGAICCGQNKSGGCWYRLQRRDGLQDHGRWWARHVQHNDRWGHTRWGHNAAEGTAWTTAWFYYLRAYSGTQLSQLVNRTAEPRLVYTKTL